jgi:hypothetical protein
MREFTSLGVEWVAKALRMSSELEVDETSTKVRRTTEIQEPKDQFERSIYAVSVILCRIATLTDIALCRKDSEKRNSPESS